MCQPNEKVCGICNNVNHAKNLYCWGCGESFGDVDQDDDYDDEIYEDDGQPDEMQEWHDFDPDC